MTAKVNKKSTQTKNIGVRFTPEQYEFIKAISEQENRSMGNTIFAIIEKARVYKTATDKLEDFAKATATPLVKSGELA
jgi:hypothetical protein